MSRASRFNLSTAGSARAPQLQDPASKVSAAANPSVKGASTGPADPIAVVSYKTPKNILLYVIKAGLAKAKMTWWRISIMGFMAGMYIGIGGLISLFLIAGAPGLTTGNEPSIQKFLGGAVFPMGLMLVVICGGELFTGNVMYISAALLGKKIKLSEAVRNWVISYFANFLGSLFFAYFFAYLPEILHAEPYVTGLQKIAFAKTENGWGVNFLRGIGANWLVCMSLFFALAADDLAGKILALWWPVMTFVTLGYEHSVANMMIIPLGLMEGANTTTGKFIYNNLIPVTLGNMIGGFVFVTLAEWMVFSEYFGDYLHQMYLKHHREDGSVIPNAPDNAAQPGSNPNLVGANEIEMGNELDRNRMGDAVSPVVHHPKQIAITIHPPNNFSSYSDLGGGAAAAGTASPYRSPAQSDVGRKTAPANGNGTSAEASVQSNTNVNNVPHVSTSPLLPLEGNNASSADRSQSPPSSEKGSKGETLSNNSGL